MCLLAVMTLLTACSKDDDDNAPAATTRVVGAQLAFSLPQTIVGEPKKDTRMTANVVQLAEDVASFRGMEDFRLLCFSTKPLGNSQMTGAIIDLPAMTPTSLLGPMHTNHATYRIEIPVGTTHIAAYARAINDSKGTTANSYTERMHYGIVDVLGLHEDEYQGNDAIRFKPVAICPTEDQLDNSSAGRALLNLLNDLLNTTSPEAAPNNQWATASDYVLQQAYQAMTALTTSSSFNVEALLNKVYLYLGNVNADAPGGQLAAQLRKTIEDCCDSHQDDGTGRTTLKLKSRFQGFPADLGLPSGAARIVWNESQHRYDYPDQQAYGKEMNVPSVTDYVYPASLYYNTLSPIMASDSLCSEEYVNYDTWQQVIDDLYSDAQPAVRDSTRSVAMVKQLQYAVGRLDSHVIMESGTYYDALGKSVDVTKGFTLKGIIIGGQRETDYDFHPVAGTKEYYIYDTDLNGGQKAVKPNDAWTSYNYTLGMETLPDQQTYLALELVNNGPDFQGADGVIVSGATFYLVASLNPKEGSNYSSGVMDQIFRKDYTTKVNLGILKGWADKDGDGKPDPDLDEHGSPKPPQGLATATYGLPELSLENRLEMGFSIDLSWNRGVVFNGEF